LKLQQDMVKIKEFIWDLSTLFIDLL